MPVCNLIQQLSFSNMKQPRKKNLKIIALLILFLKTMKNVFEEEKKTLSVIP